VKRKTPRSDRYMAFVREHASCLWWEAPDQPQLADEIGGAEPTVAHHVRMGGHGGTGIKPSDYRTVPLTDEEHRLLHQMGERTFWGRYGVDPEEFIIALLTRYVGAAPEKAVCRRVFIAQLEELAEREPAE
jgi:hypothetical protein